MFMCNCKDYLWKMTQETGKMIDSGEENWVVVWGCKDTYLGHLVYPLLPSEFLNLWTDYLFKPR